MATAKEILFQAHKDANRLRETYEAQAIIKFIDLLFARAHADMLDCKPDDLPKLQFYARAYRDLLDKLIKPIPEIPRDPTE